MPSGGVPYTTNQASYDLARLSRNELIIRDPHRNRYTLTPDGLRIIHRQLSQRIAVARLPAAA